MDSHRMVEYKEKKTETKGKIFDGKAEFVEVEVKKKYGKWNNIYRYNSKL